MQAITISNLDMKFGSIQTLQNINLHIAEGEFVSIVGPSGCGKSTLMRLVAGLISTPYGKIKIANASQEPMQKQVAFVFQESNLLPWRNILNNVKLPLELHKIPLVVQKQKSLEALEMVQLKDFTKAYPRQLSGGMKMRASLARAIVTQPNIMLLDEPFAALDEITRQKLNEELLNIWQKDKWTALFITHNVSEAIFLSNRVIVLSGRPGKIVADIKISFPYPRNPQLRSTLEFAKLIGKISDLLRQAADAT